ncbi:MAG: response regulator transcription factor [Actinomycetota bacterium]|nr:response regulator transcription factor [Actinomycetota bacterium]
MTRFSGPILVVDDDPGFRSFAKDLLERAGYEILEAADGDEALRAAEAVTPSLVLLDVHLPGTAGYVVCQELRERFGDRLPIIFVSGTRKASFDRVGGLLLGADDYIVKPFDPDELIARVKRFTARSLSEEEAAAAAGTQPSGSALPFGLTRRELQVLARLVEGRDQEEIADMLVISSKTVATHIQRILSKLGVHSRAQAVAVAARERLRVVQ